MKVVDLWDSKNIREMLKSQLLSHDKKLIL